MTAYLHTVQHSTVPRMETGLCLPYTASLSLPGGCRQRPEPAWWEVYWRWLTLYNWYNCTSSIRLTRKNNNSDVKVCADITLHLHCESRPSHNLFHSSPNAEEMVVVAMGGPQPFILFFWPGKVFPPPPLYCARRATSGMYPWLPQQPGLIW